MSTVTSRDGTRIAYERVGSGAAVVLVDGALCHRGFGPMPALASALAEGFAVHIYDRRGRGESGDTKPYAVEREVEDLNAVVSAAGGDVSVYGVSSGAALALEAAGKGVPIARLALYEPPFTTTEAPSPDGDYRDRLRELLAAGRRGDAVELFLAAAGLPPDMIAGMRAAPVWPLLEHVAATLAYDHAIMADARVPRRRLRSIAAPTLVLAGALSPPPLRDAALATAGALMNAQCRILDGQGHDVSPDVVAPVLRKFFL